VPEDALQGVLGPRMGPIHLAGQPAARPRSLRPNSWAAGPTDWVAWPRHEGSLPARRSPRCGVPSVANSSFPLMAATPSRLVTTRSSACGNCRQTPGDKNCALCLEPVEITHAAFLSTEWTTADQRWGCGNLQGPAFGRLRLVLSSADGADAPNSAAFPFGHHQDRRR
jgi:hypothetical protein